MQVRAIYHRNYQVAHLLLGWFIYLWNMFKQMVIYFRLRKLLLAGVASSHLKPNNNVQVHKMEHFEGLNIVGTFR